MIGFEYLRNLRIQRARRGRPPVQDLIADERNALAAERALAGGNLVEHGAAGKKIRAGVERLATRLFGGHVGERADLQPGDGQRRFVDAARRCRSRRRPGIVRVARDAERGRFGQAEVEHLHASARASRRCWPA